MDEIKNLLKQAKESIKNKQYRETLKLCKSVIDKEKGNYNAWLFTGVAAEELGSEQQALAAYQKAIQLAPTQPTAWQGLAQFYEKQNAFGELNSVYNELRKLFANDSAKYYEYSLRLANVLNKQGKLLQCANIYHSLLKLDNVDKNSIVTEALVSILSNSIDVIQSDVYMNLFSHLNESLSVKLDDKVVEKLHEKYLIAKIKEKHEWKEIERECVFILNRISSGNQQALLVLFKIYSQILICDLESETFYENSMKKFNELLERTSSDYQIFEYYHILIKIIKISDINNDNMIEFKELLGQLKSLDSKSITSVFMENKYSLFIEDSVNTIRTSMDGKNLLKEDLMVNDMQSYLETYFSFNQGLALFSQQKYNEAINIFQSINKESNLKLISKRYQIEALLELNLKDKAEKEFLEWFSIESDENHLKTIVFILFKLKEDNLVFAFNMTKLLDLTTYEGNFVLAKIIFQLLIKNMLNQYPNENLNEKFMSSIKKSIQMRPFKYEPVQLLGNYLKNILKDSKKALKCYQKCYELCNNINVCGLELVDCLLNENKYDLATTILRKALDEISNCKWAQLRLGLINLKNGHHNEAIRLFYAVIRHNAEDFKTWECLAEAYLNRGSQTAALKSFNKALDLNPNSNYAKYQVAFIKQNLKLYDEALVDYLKVLDTLPNHMPTLKGISETYYQLSLENIQNLTDNKFLEYIEKCIQYIYQGLCFRKDLCCFWKLLGDCTSQIYFYPDEVNGIVSVPADLLRLCDFSSDVNETLNKKQLLNLAEKSYMMCCKLKSIYGTYWYDLGLVYYRKCKLMDASKESIYKALNCLLQAVKLDPENFLNWNLLGIIYASRDVHRQALAQHSFIRSIQLESSSPLNWTNLGVFYLMNGNLKLANECFKKSQAIDPDFCVAWIGQAFIAETVDAEQSLDLYRHSVELSNHTEAQYAYGRLVSKLTNDREFKKTDLYKEYIEYMDAIPIASDCLVKYLTRVKCNKHAYLMCGILFEKQKLFNFSLDYYKELLENDANDLIEIGRRCNARVLGHLNRNEEALHEYKKIDFKASIEDTFAVAKIFYKLGRYEQAFAIYENGLKVGHERDKSIVYTALGMAAAKFNINNAINNFLKSFQSKPICLQSLFALCSIGFLKNDTKLIGAVFKELDEIIDYEHRFDILKLKSVYYSLKKEYSKSISFISKYTHESPKESKGWMELCLCLKRAQMYESAMRVGEQIFRLGFSGNTIFYECFQNILLNQIEKLIEEDERKRLLKHFQRTIHNYPASKNSWLFFQAFLKLLNEEKYQETIKNLNINSE